MLLIFFLFALLAYVLVRGFEWKSADDKAKGAIPYPVNEPTQLVR